MNAISILDSIIKPLFNLSADVAIFWAVFKIFFLIAFFMYFLFSIIVVRQVFIMTQTFKTSAETILKLFAFVHLFFSIGLIIAAYLIL